MRSRVRQRRSSGRSRKRLCAATPAATSGWAICRRSARPPPTRSAASRLTRHVTLSRAKRLAPGSTEGHATRSRSRSAGDSRESIVTATVTYLWFGGQSSVGFTQAWLQSGGASHFPFQHALPLPHGVPSGASDTVHPPVLALHAATWQASGAVQVTGFPVHAPAWHASPHVQRLPSSQLMPSAFGQFEHTPVPGSHVPASWHWSSAV